MSRLPASGRLRVVYWNNIPAPYMVERFEALARRGTLDFEAWFSARTEADRSWDVDERTWRFKHRYLPHLGRAGHLSVPWPLLRDKAPDLFVSLYAQASYIAAAAIARRRGSRTAFWVEITFDAWVARRRWREAMKSAVLPRADAVLTAGEDGRGFAKRYGVREERIFVVPHVVDSARYARESSLEQAEREQLRSRLGLRGVVFLYVGRLWHGKGLPYLIDAFARVQRESPHQVSLLLVGDGVDELALRDECARLEVQNVAFSGFHQADSLARLYAAADVFVFPTLGDPFGMVVPEAMACGLPVIATSASGEIRSRISEGVNGFVVPPADAEALRDRMVRLAGDGDYRRSMGAAAKQSVSGQSADLWAETFERAVEKIMILPRDRR